MHNAMTGNRHRQWVCCTGLRYSTHRLRRSNAFGYLLVARRGSRWNPAEGLPDALLEGCTPHIERQIETEGRRLDKSDHGRDQLLKLLVPTDELRLGELVLEIAYETVRFIPE